MKTVNRGIENRIHLLSHVSDINLIDFVSNILYGKKRCYVQGRKKISIQKASFVEVVHFPGAAS